MKFLKSQPFLNVQPFSFGSAKLLGSLPSAMPRQCYRILKAGLVDNSDDRYWYLKTCTLDATEADIINLGCHTKCWVGHLEGLYIRDSKKKSRTGHFWKNILWHFAMDAHYCISLQASAVKGSRKLNLLDLQHSWATIWQCSSSDSLYWVLSSCYCVIDNHGNDIAHHEHL